MVALVHRARIVTCALSVIALVSCDKQPTQPKQAQGPPVEVRHQITPELAVPLGYALDDVATRVAPTLGEAKAIGPINESLTELRSAIASRDIDALISARKHVAAALDALPAGADDRRAIAPDLDVMRLLLDEIDAAVAAPASAATSAK
jgi:hypothetical protein